MEYKRALSRKYRPEAAALRLFDRYLCEHAATDWSSIDSVLIENFLQSRPRCRPRSYNHLLGVLHRFFEWAVVQGFVAAQSRDRHATPRYRQAHSLSLRPQRRQAAPGVANALPDRSRAPHRAQTYEMIFALLYGLGLRVGEAVRLKLGRCRFQRDTLFIRETKFSKSRIVPLGPGWRRASGGYIEERHDVTRDPDRPLFSFTKRGCICPETISQTFHSLVPQLGLVLPPGVSSPRLHDLRHAFAVGTLLRWYRQGIDPNCRLIHLSTFLVMWTPIQRRCT